MTTTPEDVFAGIAEEEKYEHTEEAEEAKKRAEAATDKLLYLWEADAEWKLRARKIYASILTGFLVLQNTALLYFVALAYSQDRLGDFQPFLGTVLIGAFAETAYLVKIIVRWVFSDIKYSQHPLNKKD